LRAVIGLGSNLGDCLATLREACRRIDHEAGSILARSSVWRTSPIGGPPQHDFLNAAIAIESALSPRALLGALQTIELDLGRVRTVKDGPRTLDLDILWIDGTHVNENDLQVPHPRLEERAFALAPLLEVAPDAPFEMSADVKRQTIERLSTL